MRTRFPLLVGLLLVLGCGDTKYAPVSGTVTMDGKALADVAVSFQPTGEGQMNPGPGSSGRTNEKGEYSLQVIGGRGKGAVVGMHRVEVHPTVDDNANGRRPPPKIQIPAKYNRLSELRFEVKPGNNTANFDLTSK
jgi:hypothetical protein